MKQPGRKKNSRILQITQGIIDRRLPEQPFKLGILKGEGIGPEVIQSATDVLSAVMEVTGVRIDLITGGAIGIESEKTCNEPLSPAVKDFCSDIFMQGGAILCGPGGGRFVYDLRKEFDLFCKIVPVAPFSGLKNAGVIRRRHLANVDLILIRENISGIYQGSWNDSFHSGERRAEHSFCYSEKETLRILEVGARIAESRAGKMTVVVKDGGIPTVSQLWRDCALVVADRQKVACEFINIDYAAYCLIQRANELDVLIAPNLFGDILSDVSAVLLGSRALSYSGNFSPSGDAVYQTNHGAAFDLVGLNVANPAGQLFSLAMLLRESFGLFHESELIRKAIHEVWKSGWRTSDMATDGHSVVGTSEMTRLIAEAVVSLSAYEFPA
jgi:3-isopropylmalate dehydrogenase